MNDESSPRELIALIQEYTINLQKLQKQAEALRDKACALGLQDLSNTKVQLLEKRHQGIRAYLQRLRPALKKLIQRSSQWVQHGKVEDMSRFELELRLADLEASLQRAENSIDFPLQY